MICFQYFHISFENIFRRIYSPVYERCINQRRNDMDNNVTRFFALLVAIIMLIGALGLAALSVINLLSVEMVLQHASSFFGI